MVRTLFPFFGNYLEIFICLIFFKPPATLPPVAKQQTEQIAGLDILAEHYIFQIYK